jgi:hypothetical protein
VEIDRIVRAAITGPLDPDSDAQHQHLYIGPIQENHASNP